MARRSHAQGRLGGLDTAFLCLESRQAPMHLGALVIFHPQRPVVPERLRVLLCDRVERMPQLRRRAVPPRLSLGPVSWVEDQRFAVGDHVRIHRVAVGDHDSVMSAVAELMAEPLDLHRPPWQLHVLTGLPDQRFGVLIKMHHGMADGLRAVELGLPLLDGFCDLAPGGDATPAPRPWHLADMLRPPPAMLRPVATLAGLARQVTDVGVVAASVLSSLRLSVPPSPLQARVPPRPEHAGPHRRLELVRLDLGQVRQVRRRHGGTDNDVLLAVIAGALHDWLAARGGTVGDVQVRVLIPVSRRYPADQHPCGNVLSGYLCDLPVREPEPLARLRQVRRVMDRNKAAGPARGAGAFPLLADRVPATVNRLAAPLVRHSANRLFDAVTTNVPIPGLPLTLGGALLRELYPIMPLAPGHALGIAMSSYRGAVHIGVHGDAISLPDLDRFADALPAALVDLAKATGAARSGH